MNIAADEYGGGSRGENYRKAVELLKKYPTIDGIFAVNESSSEGVLSALRAAGLAGKIKFVGFDSTAFLLDLAVKAAVAVVKNTPVKDRTIFTNATMVSPENYREPEIRTLLVP